MKWAIFDIDGTLYRKDIQYNSTTGTIQDAHDFFRYTAHQELKAGRRPLDLQQSLMDEYHDRIEDGSLTTAVHSLDDQLRQEWDGLVKDHGANGRVFDEHHGLKAQGIRNYLHEMLATIDFQHTLATDENLCAMFTTVDQRGYRRGVLTSEVFKTVEEVAIALGFTLADMHYPPHPILEGYPIVCRNNSLAKPDLDGFQKVELVTQKPELTYIGDSMKKDIIPALRCGWNAVFVRNDDQDIRIEEVEIDDITMKYHSIGNIYQTTEVLR